MKEVAKIVAILLVLSIQSQAQDWLSDYEFRQPLTVQGAQVSGSLTDFPVLISIIGTDFTNNLEGNARSDGFDITFTGNDGFTPLDHELQSYDETNNVLLVWVKVNLTGADQVIYMYYGNAAVATDQSTSDVWSNGFRAVWHLDEDPNGDPTDGILDDSGFGNHGTPNGAMTTADLVTGQIGNGLDLDGANDFIDVVNSSSLQISDNTITLSGWVNFNGGLGQDEGIILKGAPNDESYLLGTNENGATEQLRLRINDSGNNSDGGVLPNTNTWHYIVGVYDGSNRIGYIDGGTPAFTSGAFSANINHDPLDPVYLGRRADARYYEGQMDELRISDTPRSSNWIQTEYNNQSTPAGFISIGTQESCNSPVPSGGTATATNEFILSGGLTTIDLTSQTTGTIAWQQSTDNLTFVGVIGGSGDGTTTYTTPALTQTTYYRALISNSGGCGIADIVSSTATVFIVPAYGIGNYANRKRIIIDATQVCGSGPHTNFPILFSYTDNDFRHTGSGGDVQNVNGYDMVFTSNDGATQLDHELESYNSTTGEVIAWVRIPSLSNSTDTKIFIYYGDPGVTADQSSTATWDANFAAVWHLEDANAEDGTTNAQNGTNDGSVDAVGQIGRGRFFDGVNDQIIVPHVASSSLDITGNQVTLEAWVKAPAVTSDAPFIIKTDATNQERYMLGIDGATNLVNTRVTTNTGHFRDDSGPVNVNDWTHIVFVYDGALGSDPRKLLYVNGTFVDSYNANGNITSANAPLRIAKRFDNRWFEGNLDELRVSTTARDADWICTEYNNQNSPATFYTVQANQPCDPMVVAGTATPFDSNIFSGQGTTISLSGNTGSTIQWQSSTDNVSFSDVVGETSTSLGTGALTQSTYYRAIVSNGSCQSVSTIASVSVRVEFLTGYSYRKKITIDGSKISGVGTLTDFPLLISLVDADLDAASNKVYEDVTGYDIVFTDTDGTTLLTQYNEEYDGTDGTFISWVKATLTGGTNKEIYMYYGNCSGVSDPTNSNTWDTNYVGVWLLNNSLADATSYSNTAADNGGTTNIAGKIGDARQFSGINQWLQVANDTELNNTGTTLTLSAWVNRAIDSNIDVGVLIKSTNSYEQHLGVEGNDVANARVNTSTGLSRIDGSTTINPSTWFYISTVYDGTNLTVLVNGIAENTDARTGTIDDTSAQPVLLGRRALGDNRFYQGIIDNARISNVARSTDWALTEYNNQNDPSMFYSVAAEEAEYYWTGNSSTDWATANNWGSCFVPSVGDGIRIPNQANDPVLDADRTIGDLIIESGATMDLNGFNLAVTGGINNEGTFNQTTGTVTFAGSTNQLISGTSSTIFNNLVISNASNINASATTEVNGTLTFTAGHILLSANALTIGNSGNIVGANSSNFIATTGTGCLKQNGLGSGGITTARLFPVGTSTTSYTPATITNSAGGTLDNFCVYVCVDIYEEGTCATGTQITTGAVNRTWFVTEDMAGNSDVTLTLQWNVAEEAVAFDRSVSNLSRHDGSGWISQVLVDASAGPPYTATASSLSLFSPFGVISDVSALPITLLSFSGIAVDNAIKLDWVTASELNNDFFMVERSVDGVNYHEIAQIEGAGTSNIENEYSYLDTEPLRGANYYRLRQVDFDGSFEYTKVILVFMLKNLNKVQVYPNPSNGTINIVFNEKFINTKVNISLFNSLGTQVWTGTEKPDRPLLELSFTNQFRGGFYWLRIENGSFEENIKLVIQQ